MDSLPNDEVNNVYRIEHWLVHRQIVTFVPRLFLVEERSSLGSQKPRNGLTGLVVVGRWGGGDLNELHDTYSTAHMDVRLPNICFSNCPTRHVMLIDLDRREPSFKLHTLFTKRVICALHRKTDAAELPGRTPS